MTRQSNAKSGSGHGRAGAIVIGGAPVGLAIVRSLGRNGVPVCVLREGDNFVATTSRFRSFSLSWPNGDDDRQIDYLVDLATTRGLEGWTVFPTSDETAALLGRYHEQLSRHFMVASPPWSVFRWAYDKRLTYRLAADVGVAFPRTYYPRTREEVARLDCAFPVILKPAVKVEENVFTHAKAWPARDRAALVAGYEEARRFVDPNTVMVQELIPGGGDAQFSYAALSEAGHPKAVLIARRTRQYPPDFGRASSFVETVEESGLEEPSQQLLRALNLTGIVELEFKRDPRDGQHKLLDINARAWAWQELGRRAGVDFPYLFWTLLHDEPTAPVRASTSVRWMRPTTDVRAAAHELRKGRLTPRQYLRSLRRPLVFALFAQDDPVPAMSELPLFSYVLYRRFRRLRSHAPG
jgi:predicted ATP-grasp superfamily ATP-dependent carboligase